MSKRPNKPISTVKLQPGDRIVWDGGHGTFLREGSSKYFPGAVCGFMHMDCDKNEDGSFKFEQEDLLEEINKLQPLTVERVANVFAPGVMPEQNGMGYVIAVDGTIYSMMHRWYHGVISAIVCPELAQKMGYEPPAEYAANVFKYQQFELECKELPLVRISNLTNIRKGHKAATPEQIRAVALCFRACGIKLNEKVVGHYRDCTARQILKDLEDDDE